MIVCIKKKIVFLKNSLLLLLFFISSLLLNAQYKKAKTLLRGKIAVDFNYFTKEPFTENQLNEQSSTLITGEFKYLKNKYKLVVQPHIRLDAIDSYRTHVDMRNLYLSYWNKNLTINAGLRLYTLGKFTGFSLVDIMNRIDIRESILAFEKLGQPSIDLKYIFKKVNFELYMMPYLREVNFNAKKSRLLLVPFSVDNTQKSYDHKQKEFKPNIAARIGFSKKNTEVIVGYFNGYNKNPDFIFNPQNKLFTEHYNTMTQWSFEWQTIYKGLTFTSELINQTYKNSSNYWGLHLALGYDISKLYQGASTMNLSIEYVNDTYRIKKQLPFGKNFITLYHFNLGDINNTSFQLKVFSDDDLSYHFFDIDISRRIFHQFKFSGKVNFSSGNISQNNPLYLNNFNTFVGLKSEWFF